MTIAPDPADKLDIRGYRSSVVLFNYVNSTFKDDYSDDMQTALNVPGDSNRDDFCATSDEQ